MNAKTHWNDIYSTKATTEVSWYQTHPQQSLDLIHEAANHHRAAVIIDIGGGPSTLVDHLLDEGFTNLSVLDISAKALATAQQRLGDKANQVVWVEADITTAKLPSHHFDIWHDRAVFHFLTEANDRRQYVQTVLHAVKPGGMVIVATFADNGPTQCSGLQVMRYDPDHLHAEFGDQFQLVESAQETHQTPFGTEQKFIYCMCRMEATS